MQKNRKCTELHIDEESGSKGAKATMNFYAVGEHTRLYDLTL